MLMSNDLIYKTALGISNAFNKEDQYLPVKLNFYIQKNKKILMELAQEIEAARQTILQSYGNYDNDIQSYRFNDDIIPQVNKELNELFELEQEVNIQIVPVKLLDDSLKLTASQMDALMFMLDDSNE